MQDYEKLGAFYLGRVFDSDKNQTSEELLLYDSKDLTTHAMCVGMTGSGKTGLCISLLEEALIDNIPTLIIDPKGDMTNLLLTFPNLASEEFLPWVNVDEARRQNKTVEEFAAAQAELWKTGLAKWDQDGERIKRLREQADFCIYTPGSTSGVPVSIIKSFAAPSDKVLEDEDVFGDRVISTVTSLLGLIGVDADPIKSREHILLSTIIRHYWEQGLDLDLSALIQSVQSPPVEKIGVFDLNTFYPSKERFELAISLNNLLAAPGFQTWLQGDALDIQQLLFTPKGKPRAAIFYIAHLSDAERMFFVSLFLNQVLAWIRGQSGTTSLRALLYFDELFGYMPPTANPPSKKPLLTLLKQARAFGLGVVLATQNPVDLDYKGLSNTGTWFIGRLQTDRDRERVLDGLASASAVSGAGFEKKKMEQIISGLGKRVFLLHNVHEDGPVVFSTRWAMSYLAGPLTRTQIKQLSIRPTPSEQTTTARSTSKITATSTPAVKPSLPPEITQLYSPLRGTRPSDAKLSYQANLWGSARIRFVDKTKGVDVETWSRYIVPVTDDVMAVHWDEAQESPVSERDLSKIPEPSALYDPLPDAAFNVANFKKWQADFQDFILRNEKIELFKSEPLKMISNPGESERDFRARVAQSAREMRDDWTEKLRKKYASKMMALESKIRTALDRVNREKAQAQAASLQTALSVGTTLLGAFIGRKKLNATTLSRAGSALRGTSRSVKEARDVSSAKENLDILTRQLEELQLEFQRELEMQTASLDISHAELDVLSIRPNKAHVAVQLFGLLWVPRLILQNGTSQLA